MKYEVRYIKSLVQVLVRNRYSTNVRYCSYSAILLVLLLLLVQYIYLVKLIGAFPQICDFLLTHVSDTHMCVSLIDPTGWCCASSTCLEGWNW